MKKRHQRVRNLAVCLTVLAVGGLLVYGQRVKEVTKRIERQIEVERAEVEERDTQLTELKLQAEAMDSLDYIKKIASEELGMVEKDTIVFKAKE